MVKTKNIRTKGLFLREHTKIEGIKTLKDHKKFVKVFR